MLVEVSCSKGNTCTTYLCHDYKEVGGAVYALSDLLDISLQLRFAAIPVIASFLVGPEPEALEFYGITLRHLPEEEYEKWQ